MQEKTGGLTEQETAKTRLSAAVTQAIGEILRNLPPGTESLSATDIENMLADTLRAHADRMQQNHQVVEFLDNRNQ